MRPSTMAIASSGTLIRRADQTPGSWAGGRTMAISAEPHDAIGAAGTARLWLGTATIEHAADFSFFPGRARVHIPIEGRGIRLHFQAPEETVALASFAQHRFDGARPLHAELIDGPISAFNLIAQPDVGATIQVLDLEQDQATLGRVAEDMPQAKPASLLLVYTIAGSLELAVAERQAITLLAGDAFIFRPGAMAETITLRRLAMPTQVISAVLRFK